MLTVTFQHLSKNSTIYTQPGRGRSGRGGDTCTGHGDKQRAGPAGVRRRVRARPVEVRAAWRRRLTGEGPSPDADGSSAGGLSPGRRFRCLLEVGLLLRPQASWALPRSRREEGDEGGQKKSAGQGQGPLDGAGGLASGFAQGGTDASRNQRRWEGRMNI